MMKAMMATVALMLLAACTNGGNDHVAMNWDHMNYDLFGTASSSSE